MADPHAPPNSAADHQEEPPALVTCCSGSDIDTSERETLVCDFGNGLHVPGVYEPEVQRVTCTLALTEVVSACGHGRNCDTMIVLYVPGTPFRVS